MEESSIPEAGFEFAKHSGREDLKSVAKIVPLLAPVAGSYVADKSSDANVSKLMSSIKVPSNVESSPQFFAGQKLHCGEP